MHISFLPQRRDETLVLEKSSGDRLRINGELFNFNPLEEGGTIPAGAVPCDWIVGPVERADGEVEVTVILPHGPNPEAWQAFPESIVVIEDGSIDVPVDTYFTVEEHLAEGGVNVVTTTYRWRQEPIVETVFVPDSEPEPEPALPPEPVSDPLDPIPGEEPANVDA